MIKKRSNAMLQNEGSKMCLTKAQSVDVKKLAIKVGGHTETPESILVEIFAAMKEKAEAVRRKVDLDDKKLKFAMLTVPQYFDEEQKEIVRSVVRF